MFWDIGHDERSSDVMSFSDCCRVYDPWLLLTTHMSIHILFSFCIGKFYFLIWTSAQSSAGKLLTAPSFVHIFIHELLCIDHIRGLLSAFFPCAHFFTWFLIYVGSIACRCAYGRFYKSKSLCLCAISGFFRAVFYEWDPQVSFWGPLNQKCFLDTLHRQSVIYNARSWEQTLETIEAEQIILQQCSLSLENRSAGWNMFDSFWFTTKSDLHPACQDAEISLGCYNLFNFSLHPRAESEKDQGQFFRAQQTSLF